MHRGFFKIHRKIIDWEWYKDIPTKTLFLHLLLKVNVKSSKFQGFDVPAGSCITGRIKLAEETGLSEQQIRTALKKLQETKEITVIATNKFTIINIVNYNEYNDTNNNNQPTINQQSTNNQPTSNQQVTTSKEVKNVISKEGNNKKDSKKDVDLFFNELKTILYNYYPNSSAKLNTANTKKKLKNLLQKKEEIKKGLDNYLIEKKRENTEVKYIKGLSPFINQEIYQDYQEKNEKSTVKKLPKF